MATSLILLKQVVIMFLLAAIGFIAFRAGKITSEGSKTIGNLLIYVSLPAVIVKGFMVERTPERMTGLLISMALAAVVLGLCVLISRLCFRNDVIASFASAFSNPGFFGYVSSKRWQKDLRPNRSMKMLYFKQLRWLAADLDMASWPVVG